MEEKRLITPKVEETIYKSQRYGTLLLSLKYTGENLLAQCEQKKGKETHILQIEIPNATTVPEALLSPILLEIEEKEEFCIKATILNRTASLLFFLHPENPEHNTFQKEDPKIITTQGFLHSLSNRRDNLKTELKLCEKLIEKAGDKTEKIIPNIEQILKEKRDRKITWNQMKEELEPSPTLDPWPEGFLFEWLKFLDQPRVLKGEKEDVEWLETQPHNWIFLANDEENSPSRKKEKYITLEVEETTLLQIRNLVLKTAINHRPEEVAQFLSNHKNFQKMENSPEKKPVENFLKYWKEKVEELQGVFLPKFG